jgi:hypothetical protein
MTNPGLQAGATHQAASGRDISNPGLQAGVDDPPPESGRGLTILPHGIRPEDDTPSPGITQEVTHLPPVSHRRRHTFPRYHAGDDTPPPRYHAGGDAPSPGITQEVTHQIVRQNRYH